MCVCVCLCVFVCVCVCATGADVISDKIRVSILQSEWTRAYYALRGALKLYHERHPDSYATIVIDEPTACLPSSLSGLADMQRGEGADKLKLSILSDLAVMAVYFACDYPTARFMFASSSAAINVLTSTMHVCLWVRDGTMAARERLCSLRPSCVWMCLHLLEVASENTLGPRSHWWLLQPMSVPSLTQFFHDEFRRTPHPFSEEQVRTVVANYGLPRAIRDAFAAISTRTCTCVDVFVYCRGRT